MAQRTDRTPIRGVRLVAGVLVGLLIVLIVTLSNGARSWADEATSSPRAATLPYGPEPHQVLDLQLPDNDRFTGLRPVLVYLHSGGWVAGNRSAVPDFVSAQVDRGYAVATIDYRLASVGPDGQPVGSFPGAIWDVKRAIRYVKANTTAWSIDPRRVVLVGASAGGYLAAFVGATRGLFEPPDLSHTRDLSEDSSVRGVVDLVGPTDLVTFQHAEHPWAASLTAAFLGCPAPSETNPTTCPQDQLVAASVTTWVDDADPPIYLAYGALDELVVAANQGEPLARAWHDAHDNSPTSASYQLIERAGHNLTAEDTLGPFTEFVDRVTRNRAPTNTL